MTFEISSPAFKSGETIPTKFTGDGEDISPALAWTDPPQGTKSFALICDDPDAPMGTWTHWVIYNIPSDSAELPENVPPKKDLPGGIKQGLNTWRRIGYGGPDPPPGKLHRYFFKIYALSGAIGIPAGTDKAGLLRTIGNRVLGQAEFYGTYGR